MVGSESLNGSDSRARSGSISSSRMPRWATKGEFSSHPRARPAPSATTANSGDPLDQLDPVAVRITHEANPRAALADAVWRPLRLDAGRSEALERLVEVIGRDRNVAVAGADLVRLVTSEVVGQLEPRPVARQSHEDVDRLVADRDSAELLEAELLVELDRAV